jgi:hypothetical protein
MEVESREDVLLGSLNVSQECPDPPYFPPPSQGNKTKGTMRTSLRAGPACKVPLSFNFCLAPCVLHPYSPTCIEITIENIRVREFNLAA